MYIAAVEPIHDKFNKPCKTATTIANNYGSVLIKAGARDMKKIVNYLYRDNVN